MSIQTLQFNKHDKRFIVYDNGKVILGKEILFNNDMKYIDRSVTFNTPSGGGEV